MSQPRRKSPRAIPGLARILAGLIGDPAVRNRGTIGGSIAHADPAADYPAACLALGATIVTEHAGNRSEGLFHRPVRDGGSSSGEMITKIVFPDRSPRRLTKNSATPPRRYAIVGVFVAKATDAAVCVAVTWVPAMPGFFAFPVF